MADDPTTFAEWLKQNRDKRLYLAAGGQPLEGRVLSFEGDYLTFEVNSAALNGKEGYQSFVPIKVPFSSIAWASLVP